MTESVSPEAPIHPNEQHLHTSPTLPQRFSDISPRRVQKLFQTRDAATAYIKQWSARHSPHCVVSRGRFTHESRLRIYYCQAGRAPPTRARGAFRRAARLAEGVVAAEYFRADQRGRKVGVEVPEGWPCRFGFFVFAYRTKGGWAVDRPERHPWLRGGGVEGHGECGCFRGPEAREYVEKASRLVDELKEATSVSPEKPAKRKRKDSVAAPGPTGKRRGMYKCGKCGELGHTIKRCDPAHRPGGDRIGTQYRCKECNGYGHSARTCKETLSAEELRKLAAKERVRWQVAEEKYRMWIDLAEERERMAGGRVDIEGRRAGEGDVSTGAEGGSESIPDIGAESQDEGGSTSATESGSISDEGSRERIPDIEKSGKRMSTKSSKASATLADSGIWDMTSDSDEA